MDNEKYKQAACDYLKIDSSQVMVFRIENDNAVLVVNNGIKGCPKHTIPLQSLIDHGIIVPIQYVGGEINMENIKKMIAETIDATPSAKKLASVNNIDLLLITGTGKDGRITRDDVRAAIKEG